MKTKIDNTIKKYNMFSNEDYVAVAFSGGADSAVLLDILYKKGIKLCAIHVNHLIRGKEADRDEEFCREFCQSRSIPFFCHRVDVPAEAQKSGESMELAARKLRYESIEKTVRAEGITRVATAHHADDNAETVIFNIVRGSGAKGGCGIPPVRGIYIRPLIDVTRDSIIEYCKANGIPYVTDSTNLSDDYTRNYIRHEIMPKLKEINPCAAEAIGRFSAYLREDEEVLAAMIPHDPARHELAELSDAVLVRYIRTKCDVSSHSTIEALMQAIRCGNEYIITDMGKGIVAVCDRNSVTFRSKITQPTHSGGILKEEVSEFEGFGRFFVTKDPVLANELKKSYELSAYTTLAFDRISGDLFVRGRIQGDSYRYCGMSHSLKKLFNSRKIPVEQRSRVPLVCDSTGIIWIPGFVPRDDVKAAKNEKNIIFIGYIKGEDNDA